MAGQLGRQKSKLDGISRIEGREYSRLSTPNSELRVVNTIGGHLGLFGVDPGYMPQIDQHLGGLLASAA